MKTNFTKLILLVAAALCSATGFAQTWTSGATTVTVAGTTLTVSGTGAMADYTISTARGWNSIAGTITKVIVEEGVTHVGTRAFHNFTGLTEASLPSTVTSINDYAFGNTSSLTEIKCLTTAALSIGTYAFTGTSSSLIVLYSGSGAAPSWISTAGLTSQATGPWTSGGVTVTISGTTLTVSGTGSLAASTSWGSAYYKGKITDVIVGSGVTGIGDGVFRDFIALETVSLPAGLTSIGANAFTNTDLTEISFPASLTSLGNFAFNGVALDVIAFEGDTPPTTISPTAFNSVVWTTVEVIVPAGSEAAYRAALPSLASPAVKGGYWVKTVASPKEGGTATPAVKYTADDSTTVVATVTGQGYAFANWTIDGKVVSSDESYKFKVDANVTVTANFKKASVSFTPHEAYYSGLPKSVQASVNDKAMGEITAVYYRYLGKAGSPLTTTPPTELGSYQILVDLAPSATYPIGTRLPLGTFSIVEAPDPGPGLPRPIYLSASAGITTSPAAGLIYITSGKDLVITARTSSTTPGLVPVVIAEPAIDAANIKYEPNADGSFTITVSNLRQETRISLDFVAASTAVDATQIWAAGSQLYIATVQAGEARIYNLVGRQVKALALAAGETYTETLPTGVYIVTLNGKSYKVLVGK